MTRGILSGLILLGLTLVPAAAATPLVEPRLTLAHTSAHQQPHLALTLDACSGKADQRIFQALVANNIPATVFVTARWLKRNAETTALMLAHPDLFQIENHGGRHIPAVDVPMKVYGIAAAGSPAAVEAEVLSGKAAVSAATGRTPSWYRGATARYNTAAIAEIAGLGEAIAGYSIKADDGATLAAASVQKRLTKVQDGDALA
eukprot:gene21495-21438_t